MYINKIGSIADAADANSPALTSETPIGTTPIYSVSDDETKSNPSGENNSGPKSARSFAEPSDLDIAERLDESIGRNEEERRLIRDVREKAKKIRGLEKRLAEVEEQIRVTEGAKAEAGDVRRELRQLMPPGLSLKRIDEIAKAAQPLADQILAAKLHPKEKVGITKLREEARQIARMIAEEYEGPNDSLAYLREVKRMRMLDNMNKKPAAPFPMQSAFAWLIRF